MANLTAGTSETITGFEQSIYTKRPVKGTAATYYPGGMLSVDATGYLVKAGDTAGTLFAGINREPKPLAVATGAADGDNNILVARPRYFLAKHSGLVVADVGKIACIVDDQTVALAATTTNDVAAGRITRWISATEVQIETLPFGQNA